MLTAHLPSGYLLARAVRRPVPYLMSAALTGAVLPDLDMLWFGLVDHASVHHHRYWPHIPLIWAGLALICSAALWRTGYLLTGVVFFAAIFLHLLLDTIAGGILWGFPFSTTLFALVVVPASQSNWVLSFILHWTFLLELAVWFMAIAVWFRPQWGRTAA